MHARSNPGLGQNDEALPKPMFSLHEKQIDIIVHKTNNSIKIDCNGKKNLKFRSSLHFAVASNSDIIVFLNYT